MLNRITGLLDRAAERLAAWLDGIGHQPGHCRRCANPKPELIDGTGRCDACR